MFIYKTTNLINGKIYIGKHKGNSDRYLGSGKYLIRAIKKYGRENFARVILEDEIENDETLSDREIYWISFYDATNPDIGYNISPGGQGGDITNRAGKTFEEIFGPEEAKKIKSKIGSSLIGKKKPQSMIDSVKKRMTGRTVSESTKRRQSESRRGIIITPETRQKMSRAKTGQKRPSQSKFMIENNPMSGKEHTPETRRKISEKNSGVKRGPMTEENKKKISDANKGKPKSEETKSKFSIAAKKRVEENGSVYNKKMDGSSSKYRGVYYEKRSDNWRGQIPINGVTYYIGMFRSEIEAAMGINELLWEHLGWKARGRVNDIAQEEIEHNWNVIPPEKKIPRRSKK